mgnify:FL=1
MEKEWTLLATFNEPIQAELLRGLLEAQGIQVLIAQEGAAKALGVNVGILGEIEVLVPAGEHTRAEQIMNDYFSGNLEAD